MILVLSLSKKSWLTSFFWNCWTRPLPSFLMPMAWLYIRHDLHLEQLVSKTGVGDVTAVYTSRSRLQDKNMRAVRGLLVVCVSCKIHSPRISWPAPCEGFSPSRVRTKTRVPGSHGEKTFTRQVYAQRPLLNSTKELLRGDQKRDMHTGLSVTK